MRTLWTLLALVGALVLQTTLTGPAVDLVLVVVVVTALSSGASVGLLVGMVGGLAQDVLSGGIVGVSGLAKTAVGFLSGVVGTQLIVSGSIPRFLVIGLATGLGAFCFFGIDSLVRGQPFAMPGTPVLLQAAGNGLVGVVALRLIEGMPGVVRRRQMGRGSISRRL